jgi:hypothetical protein
MQRVLSVVLLSCIGFAAQAQAPADTDVYCVADLHSLTYEGGTLPSLDDYWQSTRRLEAVLDGPGEAHVQPDASPGWDDGTGTWGAATGAALAVRLPAAADVAGRLFVAAGDGTPGVVLRFQLAANGFTPDARSEFLRVARAEAAQHLADGLPGAAWWRHRVAELSRELGDTTPAERTDGLTAPSNIEDTFALFSGGRAVAENLQLDRTLPATPEASDDDVRDVDSLPGITVDAYDWQAAVAGKMPELDPLSVLIPADQHALFFPSFTALADMADRIDQQGTAVLEALSSPAEEARSRQRYERQLGLPFSDIARLLGPRVIRSVALTGSDPYLRAGSDVAILFEAFEPEVLQPLVLARVAAATAGEPGVETLKGDTGGLQWTARVSPGREVCSYVTRVGSTVVVTNSPAQLARLAAVANAKAPALSSLPEYLFFRDRYARGDAHETALLVLSDATIRRWCGPRWRIGASRRTRAEAQLAELQAAAADAVARGAPGGEPGPVADAPAGLGAVERTPDGVRSAAYGTLGFLTPIAELDLSRVSQEEAELYARWRDGYQNNWTGVFDPIAVRFDLGPQRLALDLTVRPLIARSEYRDIIDFAGNAKIAPQACDPHPDALLQLVVAVDKQSGFFGRELGMARLMMPQADPFAWLGSSISVYLEGGPFWDELRASEDPERDFEDRLDKLPIALHAEVGDPLLLAGALMALRGLAEQAAPGMVTWENATLEGEPYVIVRPTREALEQDGIPEDFALRYSPSAAGLVLTPDQALLERALKRRIERRAAAAMQPPPAPPAAWLGEHLCVRVDGALFAILEDLIPRDDYAQLRALSFDNIPILNEWHRLFPDADPLATHNRLWHRELTCPGGGTYSWNEEWQTMESSVYGHPGAPRRGPALPHELLKLASAQAGLTFEADGLRARVELVTKP